MSCSVETESWYLSMNESGGGRIPILVRNQVIVKQIESRHFTIASVAVIIGVDP